MSKLFQILVSAVVLLLILSTMSIKSETNGLPSYSKNVEIPVNNFSYNTICILDNFKAIISENAHTFSAPQPVQTLRNNDHKTLRLAGRIEAIFFLCSLRNNISTYNIIVFFEAVDIVFPFHSFW